jgi:hypothetical protein
MAWQMDSAAIASALISGIEGMVSQSNITIYPAKIPQRNPITGEITGYTLPVGYSIKALVIEEYRNEVNEQGKADNPVNRITVIVPPTSLSNASMPVTNYKYIDPVQAQIKYKDWLFDVVRVSTPGANGNQVEAINLHIEAKRVTKQPQLLQTQASNIVISNVLSDRATITWSRGTGTGVTVFVKRGSDTTLFTPNNAQVFTGNAVFGIGTQFSNSGWYCVYRGSGTTVTVTNLSADSSYQVAIFEYVNSTYLAGIGDTFVTWSAPPGTQVTNLTVDSTDVTWVNGSGENTIVMYALGTVIPDDLVINGEVYTVGTDVEVAGWKCISNGVGTSVAKPALLDETEYTFLAYSYNGDGYGNAYLTTTGTNYSTFITYVDTPTVQVASLEASVTGNSVNLTWVNGSGDETIIIYANTDILASDLVTDYTIYEVGNDVDVTGWQCLYKGTDEALTLSDLSLSSKYTFVAFSYSGSLYPVYNTSVVSNTDVATILASAPSNTTNIVLSNVYDDMFDVTWVSGTGENRGLWVHAGATSDMPSLVDGTAYNVGAIVDGWELVSIYNDLTTSDVVTGLNEGTLYAVCVTDYNGTGDYSNYALTNNIVTTTTLIPIVKWFISES